jgi:hypothetical protein
MRINYSDLKEGMMLRVTDDGFDCIEKGTIVEVNCNGSYFWVSCDGGNHYLVGQRDEDGILVGLELVSHQPGGLKYGHEE